MDGASPCEYHDIVIECASEAFGNMVADSPQNQSVAVELGAIEILRKLPNYGGPVASRGMASSACDALAGGNPVVQKLIIYSDIVKDIATGTRKYAEDADNFSELIVTLLRGGEENTRIFLQGRHEAVLGTDLLVRDDVHKFLRDWPSAGRTWQEFEASAFK